MGYRIEHDSLGEVKVPDDCLWGAQTQRSKENFQIGNILIPIEIIQALSVIKRASAIANHSLRPDKITDEKLQIICEAGLAIENNSLDNHFPLSVYQTGSGTQTNMNVNEVISNYARNKNILIHPNDDVNLSQSSNDTFPSAMHIAAFLAIHNNVLPALNNLIKSFKKLESENYLVLKCGRTHLQDATPIRFSQEISGWRSSLEQDFAMIENSAESLRELALGGTAVGTGLNAPSGFDTLSCSAISDITGYEFKPASNKFHALTSRDEMVYSHGALKALAADLMKIANDIRWLSSGPRNGLGEISIPVNEPGSSIMPGKVNPTQCEAVTMVSVQVLSNDFAVSMAASQGNFELNVFAPVCAYNYLQSCRILSDVMNSFRVNCVDGIVANKSKMECNLNLSLMLVTALSPHIGYEKSAEVALKAFNENISLKEACFKLGYLTKEQFDLYVDPEKMV